ncbi:MAG: glycosyltransferase family 2 protein [Prolixibacteraceae bacterium]|nr:glycosyltransferase family 2 protein [Prolixibacteraceae bacterium]
MKNKLLSIVIPAFNESNTILSLLEKLKNTDIDFQIEKELVIVNDCSTDDTERKIISFIKKNPNLTIQYIKHDKNQGKGAALRNGFERANGDFIIIQDADLEYDPAEYNNLLKPMVNSFADVVYGSRFMGGKPHRILFYWHSVGNKLLTGLLNVFTNLNLTDIETCYKLFRAEIIKGITIVENRFGFEPEITAKISRIPNIRIYEVGISYYGRTYNEGKKINWKDGVRAIYCIFKYGLLKR